MNKKQLLLKDLCARLPYNVIINCTEEDDEKTNFNCFLAPDMIKDIKSETAHWIIKPYLRSISSITEEEKKELAKEQNKDEDLFLYIIKKSQEGDNSLLGTAIPHYAADWANKNHIDYRGLIPMGLALEAPEGMYKTEGYDKVINSKEKDN